MGEAKRRGSKEARIAEAEPKSKVVVPSKNVKFMSAQAMMSSMALIQALNFAPIKIKTQGPPKKRAF